MDDEFINRKIGFIRYQIKNLKHYDSPEKLVDEIDKWLRELSFFYNTIVKDGDDPSEVMFNLKPSKRPAEGQMVYVNLRRGYPKEQYDDHWCYVLKDFGTKLLIIPATSIKDDSKPCNESFDMDINDKTPNGISRLHFTEMKFIDIMRVCQSLDPNHCDVVTPRKDIVDKINSVLSLDK